MSHLARILALLVVLGMAALVLLASSAACAKHPTKPVWELAWRDEFDGPAGQLPDPTRWAFDVGTDWGNNQLEYDTARPENVSLDGAGNLVITARKESYNGCEYTSGRINTNGRFSQTLGRFEARMRMPRGQGMWPAFWLLGANFATVGWPACGEIDILEYRGQHPDIMHGALHGPGYSGGAAVTRLHRVSGPTLDASFHVYAVEWSKDKVTWLVDDVAWFTANPGSLPRGSAWVFDHPFFVILDLAVGGGFVGPPDSTTVFPQQLVVDYVRVYRRK